MEDVTTTKSNRDQPSARENGRARRTRSGHSGACANMDCLEQGKGLRREEGGRSWSGRPRGMEDAKEARHNGSPSLRGRRNGSLTRGDTLLQGGVRMRVEDRGSGQGEEEYEGGWQGRWEEEEEEGRTDGERERERETDGEGGVGRTPRE
jgi:hypothetical protein